jgi:glycosyltransferase involved in cell wall biosynthesis
VPEPKVSVVIPCYNGRRYLDECLRSIADRDDCAHEAIVVDDGSTEEIRDVVERWAPIARYLWQPNQGPGAARNNGAQAAAGQYIRYLDCDDYLLPTTGAAEQVALLDAHPEVGLVYGQALKVDAAGRQFGRRRSPFAGGGYVHSGEEELRHLLLRGNYMTTSTVVVRRSALEQAGPFRTDIWSAEDWDCWLRIAEVAGVGYVDEPVTGYRVHEASITASYTPTRWLRIHHDILDRTFADQRFPAQLRDLRRGAFARLDGVAAMLAYSNQRMDLARSYGGRALVTALGDRQWRDALHALSLIARSTVPSRLRQPLRRAGRRYRIALAR